MKALQACSLQSKPAGPQLLDVPAGSVSSCPPPAASRSSPQSGVSFNTMLVFAFIAVCTTHDAARLAGLTKATIQSGLMSSTCVLYQHKRKRHTQSALPLDSGQSCDHLSLLCSQVLGRFRCRELP